MLVKCEALPSGHKLERPAASVAIDQDAKRPGNGRAPRMGLTCGGGRGSAEIRGIYKEIVRLGVKTHGFGAELVAELTEKHFFALEAPPLRIAALDLPVPFAPELEQAFRPTVDKAIEQIIGWMG